MFFHACANRQNVGIKDDVCGREAGFFRQQVPRTSTDSYFVIACCGLPRFIEGHDDHRGTEAPDQSCLLQEFLFAFLQADTVDDAFSLTALQTGFDDIPV